MDLLNLLTTSLATVIPTASTLISNWMDAIDQTNYFSLPSSSFMRDETNLQRYIQALCLTATIGFLDFDQDMMNVPPGAYISDAPTLIKIHKVVIALLSTKPNASPVAFGWASILYTISGRLSVTGPDDLSSFLDVALANQNSQTKGVPRADLLSQVAQNIAKIASHSGPISILSDTVSLLSNSSFYMTIYKGYLVAILPHVSFTERFVSLFHQVVSSYPQLAESAFIDPYEDKLFSQISLRFPSRLGSFLLLVQCLGSAAFETVSKMNTIMLKLPHASNYKVINGADEVQLTSQLTLLTPTGKDPGHVHGSNLVLRVGTKGQTFDNDNFVIWRYDFNGWGFLCRILEQYLLSKNYPNESVQIVNLINTTLSHLEGEEVNAFMRACGEELVTCDIVELIFKTLEDAAFACNTELAQACVDFTATLACIYPHGPRVWSYLGRSALLERNGQEALIAVILESTEIVNAKYNFTLSLLNLVKRLVEAAVGGILTTHVSTNVQSQIMVKLVSHMVGLFENFAFWAYADSCQKVRIPTDCVDIFSQILSFSLDIDETVKPEEKVTSVLAASVELLATRFLSTSKVVMHTLQPLLANIESASWSPVSLDSDYPLSTYEGDWMYAALKFSSGLVCARQALGLLPSEFERNLYVLAPHLALLYTRYSNLRGVIVDVFTAIVKAAWPNTKQPSLLAHLGMHAQMFISNLTGSLENDLEDELTVSKIAICFTAIIESQQEGLSILLLTGREAHKRSEIGPKKNSLLQVIEKKVSSARKDLPQDLLLNLLDSMATAYNNWKLGEFSIPSEVTDALISIVKETYQFKVQDESLERSFQNSICEKALLILAVQLFKSKDVKATQKFLDYLESDDNLYKISAVFLTVKGFRSSLHGNLARNFQAKWPTLGGIERFSRSRPLVYGLSYKYDLDMLDRVLGGQDAWTGYRKEVINANLNHSWIHSQLALVKAWCTISTSLVTLASKVNNMQLLGGLGKVSNISIDNILSEDYSIPILREAVAQRVQLNYIISHHLSNKKLSSADVHSLTQMFNLLVSDDFGFLRSVSTSGNVEISGKCYRYLLRAIIISLGNFKDHSAISNFQLKQVIQSIFSLVIINGMNAAVYATVEEQSPDATDDMVLIIATLQTCLAIPGVSAIYPTVTSSMMEYGCARSVMSLYWYAQSISDREDEFCKLSLSYLLQWLNIDTIADHLVSIGVLNALVESPISQGIHNGGVRPTTHQRLHSLWVEGILPIAITLLHKLGSRIVHDILLVLAYFSEQVKFALIAWRNPSDLTLEVITETSQLLLLIELVYKFHPTPSLLNLEFVPPTAELDGYFDHLLLHPRFLNSIMVPTTAEEIRWAFEPEFSGSADLLEGNKLLKLFQDKLKDIKELLLSRSDTESDAEFR